MKSSEGATDQWDICRSCGVRIRREDHFCDAGPLCGGHEAYYCVACTFYQYWRMTYVLKPRPFKRPSPRPLSDGSPPAKFLEWWEDNKRRPEGGLGIIIKNMTDL